MNNSVAHNDDWALGILFKIFTLAILIGFVIAELVLPVENDAAFWKAPSLKQRELSTFSEPVFWVREDGARTPIELPGHYDVRAGDVMALESALPEITGEIDLILRASQQNMKIYVGGELRVDYDTKDTRPFGTQTASRYVFCRLSKEDSGAALRVELLSPNAGYSGVANEIYLGDRFEFWSEAFARHGLELAFGVIIVLLGAFTVALSLCLQGALKERLSLEYIGWCVLLAGVWLVGESRLRQLLVPNPSALSNLCFVAPMLGPFPLCLYVNSLQRRRYDRLYHGLMGVALLNTVVSFGLQLSNRANFLDTMAVSHGILLGVICAILVTFALDARKGLLRAYRLDCIGLVCGMAAVATEVAMVYSVTMLSGVFLTVGAVALVLFSCVSAITEMGRRKRLKALRALREEKQRADEMAMQLIQTLSQTLEAKDEYTRGHSGRVAEYATLLAQQLGLDEKEVASIRYAASLHDIGKIGVPDSILNKPALLTNEEYAVIKRHSSIGSELLQNVNLIAYAAPIARSHHERYDGKGYPDGLAGEDIPYAARIVAIADSFDAMISRRVYKKPLEWSAARQELANGSGTQFDPKMVEAFLALFDAGKLRADEPAPESANPKAGDQVITLLMDTLQSKLTIEATDLLTGLPTRGVGEKAIADLMKQSGGALAFVDMDHLKRINDINGHKAGDRALRLLGSALRGCGEQSYACRVGGDEFLLWLQTASEEETIERVQDLMRRFDAEKRKDASIAEASLSIGLCACAPADDYAAVVGKADKALYHVKQRGKNGYYLYRETKRSADDKPASVDLERLVASIHKAGKYSGAMDMEYREFPKIYEYISNLSERYKCSCYLVMVTLDADGVAMDIDVLEQVVNDMGIAIRENIRSVDVCARFSSIQYLVILYEPKSENIDAIMRRVFLRFHQINPHPEIEPTYVSRLI